MKVRIPFMADHDKAAIARIVDRTADAMGMEDAEVARCMSYFLEYTADEVTKGHVVSLAGFGQFHPVPHAKRLSGPRLKSARYAVPKFVASPAFRWQVAHGAPPNARGQQRYKNARANSVRRSMDHERVFSVQAKIRHSIAKQLGRNEPDEETTD